MAENPHILTVGTAEYEFTDHGLTIKDAGITFTTQHQSATPTASTIAGAHTVTNETLTAPTLNTPTINAPIYPDYKVLAASITYTSNVTAATITGFSWTVVAGATYVFEVNLPVTITTTGGLTISFKLTTATLTSIQYQSYAASATDNADAVSTNGTTTTDATKVFDSKTAAYTHVTIKGSMVVNAGGTFAIQGCQNTSAGGADVSVVLLGSYAVLKRAA